MVEEEEKLVSGKPSKKGTPKKTPSQYDDLVNQFIAEEDAERPEIVGKGSFYSPLFPS